MSQTQGLPNIPRSSSQKTKTLESILNAQIKYKQNKVNPFKTLPNPNPNRSNVSFLKHEKFETKQDQYYSSPLLTKSQLTEVEHLTRQSKNDFYSQMLSDNPFQYNEYQNNSNSEYNKKISDIQVNFLDIKNKERVKEFLQETTSFQKQISTHTQRPKRVNVLTQRQDVIKLAQWLDYQMEKIVGNKNMIQQQQLSEIETVFNLSLKELVREISIDCVEKSVLLEKVWNQYSNYNWFLLKSIDDERSQQENDYLNQIKSLHQTYQNSVKFLEEKLRQIDEEFNSLSTKFERKKFKLQNIRGSYLNITEQKKDMEQELDYLRNERRDLKETKEQLLAQVQAQEIENERLSVIIISKQQEFRTQKTRRYSQMSLDSCVSDQNHKVTHTEDLKIIMALQQVVCTQTEIQEDEGKSSVLIQTDIRFFYHVATQTASEDNLYSQSPNSSFYNANNNQKNDQTNKKLIKELEEKLRLQTLSNQELLKAKQQFIKDQEVSLAKIAGQDSSIQSLQKEIERLQQEIQQLMQSRHQKKRTIVSLDDANGDQMSLGPVKELQKASLNQNMEKQGLEKSNQLIQLQNKGQSENNLNTNIQGAKSPQSMQSSLSGQTGKNQINSNLTKQQLQQQSQQNESQGMKKESNQQVKKGIHQKKLSDTNKPPQIISPSSSKSRIISQNQKKQDEHQQQKQTQSNADYPSYQPATSTNKFPNSSTITPLESLQKFESLEKEQLNSQQIRNTLLSLNEVENDEVVQFENETYNQGDEIQQQGFKRSNTKKLSYKLNSSLNSQNSSVYVSPIQRKGSYINPGPGTKTLREKENIYADVALEFIKSFTQSIKYLILYVSLQKPEEFEQTMSLQSVFKLITQFYKERLERKQPIYVICYEFYMNTFGLKQIAENKLTMLCQAVVFYNNVPRVKLFARFLQIFDGITDDDLEFYFTTLGTLDKSQKAENLITCMPNLDCVQVPYEKAMDQLSTLQEQIKEVEQQLRKGISFINGVGMVDVDLFFLEALQQFQLMRKIHKDNFKELFEAVDINEDTYISIEEFQILFELLEGKENLSAMKKKFKAACRNQEGLVFYQFGMFCLNNELFKKEKQDQFMQFNLEQYNHLQSKWNELRRQITARLKNSLSFSEYYQDLVRKLDIALKNNYSYAWLLWRILDEQSRKLVMENIINSIIGPKLIYICEKNNEI